MEYPAHTRYYVGFNLVPGVGPARLARLIERCGSVAQAWHADAFDLAAAGLDARSSAAFVSAQQRLDLDAELARLQRADVQVLTLEDPTYPALLREAPGAPPLIYVRGEVQASDSLAVAVVGTRTPTIYGREATLRIVSELAAAGITIVSGLALGIDAIAHTAALEAGGRTLAVLGSGVDQPYPERNRRLAERIMQQGALISDYPLGTKPVAANFPPRNRIISGLSLGSLVIEAGLRSGALITVNFALEQGRDVFAVPGSIFSPQSAGPLQLIRDGALAVSSAADLLDAIQISTAHVQHEARNELPSDPVEMRLLELLSYTPQHTDELGRAAALSAGEAAATLALLELKGFARQAGPMQYVRAR
jgi:DNA processing protein